MSSTTDYTFLSRNFPTHIFGRHWSRWSLTDLRAVIDYGNPECPCGGTKLELHTLLYNTTCPHISHEEILLKILRNFRVHTGYHSHGCSIYAWTSLDSGAERNLICLDLVDPFSMSYAGGSAPSQGFGGVLSTTHGMWSLRVFLTDSAEQTQGGFQTVVAMCRSDMLGQDMVLGMPWHVAATPRIQYDRHIWYYPNDDSDSDMDSEEDDDDSLGDGYNAGYNAGYSAGHDDGYVDDHDEGAEDGSESDSEHRNDNSSDGCSENGSDEELEDAPSLGYVAGYDAGYSDGYDNGYADSCDDGSEDDCESNCESGYGWESDANLETFYSSDDEW